MSFKGKGKGTNPASHHNRSKIGNAKLIRMSDDWWNFVKEVGGGSYANGIRICVEQFKLQNKN